MAQSVAQAAVSGPPENMRNKTDEHPLMTLADGPAGRRPRLAGIGLDVWEAIGVVRDSDGIERAAADYLQLSVDLLIAAA